MGGKQSASPEGRLRGRKLQAIRREWFELHPLCVRCEKQGRVRLAVHLDHIQALSNGGLDFDEDDGQNRQGLCIPCHDIKTAEDLGYAPTGGDVEGMPTDPRHAWNQSG